MEEEKRRSRTIEWTDPARYAEAASAMSGLEYLRAAITGAIEDAPVSRLIGFQVLEAEEGRVVFGITPSEYHYNPFGVVHGGIPAAVIDAATGSAVYTLLPAGVGYTSIDLKVNFVRPVTSGAGPLRCEAHVVHSGTRTAIAEAKLMDAQGRLYAFGVSTCMIFR
jgi:uncharacterized protein (TIGR00369 family)